MHPLTYPSIEECDALMRNARLARSALLAGFASWLWGRVVHRQASRPATRFA